MSLIGTVSGKDLECQVCGEDYGHNSVHLGDADFVNSFAHNVAYTGSSFNSKDVVYVCDGCLHGALMREFGFLLD